MARIFKQRYAKTTIAKDAAGQPVKLPNGQYKRVPRLDAHGKPIIGTARRWTIEYTDNAGKVRRKCGYPDKLATEQLAAKLERRAARRAEGIIDATDHESLRPIREHLEDYWQHLEAKRATPRHIAETRAKLEKIVDACAFARLLDIQPGPIERFLSKLMTPPPKTEKVRGQTLRDRARGRSPRTRDTYFSAIRALVRWAVKNDKLPRNPLETISELRDEADVRRKRRALTDHELRELLKAAQARPLAEARFMKKAKGQPFTEAELRQIGQQRALIYKTLVLTALREDELRRLTWPDLDLKDPHNAWLDIPAEITKAGEAASIPIRADLAADLARWRKQRGRQATASPVFTIPQNLARVLRKDLKHAGIPYNTKAGYADVHALRHTTGTRLTNAASIPTRVAQEFMRHSDQRLTTGTYTDPRFLDLRAAADGPGQKSSASPSTPGDRGSTADCPPGRPPRRPASFSTRRGISCNDPNAVCPTARPANSASTTIGRSWNGGWADTSEAAYPASTRKKSAPPPKPRFFARAGASTLNAAPLSAPTHSRPYTAL